MIYLDGEKIKKVKLDTKSMYVAIDFDRTITGTSGVDSWDATGILLGEEFKNKLNELYLIYRPIELDYSIPKNKKEAMMEKWYKDVLDLYYEYGLTKEKLEKSVRESNLVFRDNAQDFLKSMYSHNIPVIILSAGIGNVIELFLKDNHCYYGNIFVISNFIIFNDKGEMERFKNKIIHTTNKTTKGNLPQELEKQINTKKTILLLGDIIDDKKMVEKENWSKTISIGLPNDDTDSNLELYKNNFDIVLTDNDANFEVVRKLVFNE